MADLVVRPAGPADAAAIAAVGAQSFEAAYGPATHPDDLAAHIEAHFTAAAVGRSFAAAGCRYLVAETGGGLAGFVQVRSGTPPPAVPAARALEIGQLYVAPAGQRRGTGLALVDAVLAIAAGEAAEGIWLTAWEDADWAISFYARAGFRRVGSAVFRVGETLYRDALLWRPVGPEPA